MNVNMFVNLFFVDFQNYLRESLDVEYYTHVESARRVPEVPGKASHRLHLGIWATLWGYYQVLIHERLC